MNELYLRRHEAELSKSQSVILPICIVVDISKSMVLYKLDGKTRMERLKEGIAEFLREVRIDERLADSVEISVIAFNNEAVVIQDFTTIENLESIEFPQCCNSGDTPKGVELALSVLENEKAFLSKNKRNYYQPWMVIMSDGRATVRKGNDVRDLNNRLAAVQKKAKELEKRDKLTVIPVLISEDTDGEYMEGKSQMQGFTTVGRCKEIGNKRSQTSFREFFRMLRKSVSASVSSGANQADMMFDKPQVKGFNRGIVGKDSENVYNTAEDVALSDRATSDRYKGDQSHVSDVSGDGAEQYRKEYEKMAKTLSVTSEVTESKVLPTESYTDNNDTLDYETVDRLRGDSIISDGVSEQKPHAGEANDSAAEESVQTEAAAPSSEASVPTVTRVAKHDDSYVKRLLASLTDWDRI